MTFLLLLLAVLLVPSLAHALSPLEWMTDPALFGQVFGGPSWEAARALVCAIYALPMTPAQLAIYQECTRRTLPPTQPFREVWITSGRRSGKSILTAFLAVYTALRRDWRECLAPGEVAYIPIYAVDRAQAAILFRYCRGLLSQSKMCEDLITAETRHSISFSTCATIGIGTRDYRRSRGASSPFLALEETPVWPADEQSANPAQELLRAVAPTQATFPDEALLISIGSAFAKQGIHYEKMARYEGTDDPRTLTWRSSTIRMHPGISAALIEQALADDPDGARAEYFSEERNDISSYLNSDAIMAVCVPDRVELPPTKGHGCFVDSAAGGA